MRNIYHVNPYWIMKQLDRRNQVLSYELEELKKKYNKLNSQYDNVVKGNMNKKRHIEELNNTIQDLQNKQQTKLNELSLRIQTATNENINLEDRNKKLRVKNKNLREKINALETELNEIKNKSLFTNIKEKLFK